MPFYADLHCHTTCSDGSLSPEEIVRLAKEKGLSGLSITDHDTIDAYTWAIPEAKKQGIELITGVEFSASHAGVPIHILAYAFSLESEEIKNFCQLHHARRDNRNKAILEKLRIHNMPVSMDEIFDIIKNSPTSHSDQIIGRPHIAQVMVNKGYVKTIQDAFRLYLAEDKSCYDPGKIFTVQETIDVIHKAKGIAVIAHPHLIKNSKVLFEILELNFDGIECFYACFYPEQNKRWIKIAQKKNWLMTGGSDFHGDIKPNLPLGASGVDEKAFRAIQNVIGK